MSGELSGDINWTEVDGVPVVWGDAPGPLRAGLTFRVGAADETLPTRGTTHTLEHLALFGIGRPGDHSNGYVDQTTTNFHTVGDPTEVAAFFGRVCDQLVTLPLSRLEDERGVLLAESAGQRSGSLERLLVWRYGAADYGLAAQDQLGLRRVDGDQLSAWSQRYFTRQNAVLWLSGPPPAGLRLALPDGERQPPPNPWRTVLPAYPAWIEGPADGACLDALLPRSTAATFLSAIMRSRLVDELRVRQAASYSPDTGYQRLTGDVARLMAVTDFVPERVGAATRSFLSVLQQLEDPAGSGATDAEVDEVRQIMLREYDNPMRLLGAAVMAGWDLLHGAKPRMAAETRDGLLAVQPEGVHEAAVAAWPTVLAVVPPDQAPRGAGWHAAPPSVVPPVVGRVYHPRGAAEGEPRLIHASEGLTWQHPDGTPITARVANTAAVLRWADGRREIIADDANRVVIEPTLWQRGETLVDEIDKQWPAELMVDMGGRPADEIPRPHKARAFTLLRAVPWLVRFGAVALITLIVVAEWPEFLVTGTVFAVLGFEIGWRRRRQGEPAVAPERPPLAAPPL